MKMWIKCPYPGEKVGEGKWFECTTPYLKRLYKAKWCKLPKMESENDPNN